MSTIVISDVVEIKVKTINISKIYTNNPYRIRAKLDDFAIMHYLLTKRRFRNYTPYSQNN